MPVLPFSASLSPSGQTHMYPDSVTHTYAGSSILCESLPLRTDTHVSRQCHTYLCRFCHSLRVSPPPDRHTCIQTVSHLPMHVLPFSASLSPSGQTHMYPDSVTLTYARSAIL